MRLGWLGLSAVLGLASCGDASGVVVRGAEEWQSHVDGDQSEFAAMRFNPGVCQHPLKPERKPLGEGDIIEFLQQQNFGVQVERPRADLSYLVVTGPGISKPVRLRVAILENAELAGEELHQAVLEHGPGSWGVHRSNIAILGPVSEHSQSLTFAAQTKLACWGVFTIAGRDDAYVVPGGYLEI